MKGPRSLAFWLLLAVTTPITIAQEPPKAATGATATVLAPSPSALGVPQPGSTNDVAYAPQPILQGGVVVRCIRPVHLSSR